MNYLVTFNLLALTVHWKKDSIVDILILRLVAQLCIFSLTLNFLCTCAQVRQRQQGIKDQGKRAEKRACVCAAGKRTTLIPSDNPPVLFLYSGLPWEGYYRHGKQNLQRKSNSKWKEKRQRGVIRIELRRNQDFNSALPQRIIILQHWKYVLQCRGRINKVAQAANQDDCGKLLCLFLAFLLKSI